MVTVSSLRMSMVADTTRLKAGISQAQDLIAKAERDIGKKQSKQTQEQVVAEKQRTSQAGAFVAAQKNALKTAAKGFILYKGAQAAMGQIRGGLDDAMAIEATQSQFETMTGSADRAANLMSQLRQFDAQTTFGFTDTVQGAQRLMNYGVAAEDVVDVLGRLGDISGGSADRLHGLTLAFGQATSLGRLQREEVNQMVERGFNPMMEITKLTGETMEQLSKRMAAGGVSAGELRQAIDAATSAGGRFFGLMDKRSTTTAGQLDLLRGEWEMLRADFAKEIGLPTAGVAAQGGNWMMRQFKNAQGEWEHFFENSFFNTGRKVGGNAKANKILMDLASFERREREALQKKEERRQGQAALFSTGKKVGGDLVRSAMDTAGGLANIGLGGLRNIAGNASFGNMARGLWDGATRWGELQERLREADQSSRRQADMPGTASRGSREEFQLRRRMDVANEEKKRHEESQALRREIRDELNQLRQKISMPELVGGSA